MFAKKDQLCRELRRLQRVHGSAFYFAPTTYILPNEFKKFQAELTPHSSSPAAPSAKHRPKRGGGVWICKPADLSRGRKIYLLRDVDDLAYDCNTVVQRYIERPLLIGGYKWDLRVYVLLVGGERLRIFLFKEGLVRFGTQPYDLADLGNKFSHLTNSSINKHSPLLRTVKRVVGDGAKWPFARLWQYLG